MTLIAARDIVRSRTWTRSSHVSIQSRTHISALAAPPDVNVSTNRVSVSRRIIPSSITCPRSLSSNAYRERPTLMSATWHGYSRSSSSTTSGPETTSLPSVLTSPMETPSRTAQYSATGSP